MSKIVSKAMWFDMAEPVDIKNYNIYYVAGEGPITYDSPKVEIPAVTGQTAYEVDLPAMVPVEEGTYSLGVAAVDNAGNISDINVITGFFDFTAPLAPVWRATGQ